MAQRLSNMADAFLRASVAEVKKNGNKVNANVHWVARRVATCQSKTGFVNDARYLTLPRFDRARAGPVKG